MVKRTKKKKKLLKSWSIFLNGVKDYVCVVLLGLLVPGPVLEVVGGVLGEQQAHVVT